MKDQHVMLDLETMGTNNDAAIIAIGATAFTYTNGIHREFYVKVNLTDAMEHNGKVNGDTVLWWLQQSEEARREVYNASTGLLQALEKFTAFINSLPSKPVVWGNGATFDNVILRSAYKNNGLKAPWHFTQDGCYRTLKHLVKAEHPELPELTNHNALHDAIWQTHHILNIFREMQK